MLACGKNVAREILNTNVVVKNIFLLESFNNEELLSLISKNKIKCTYKTQSEMDKLTKENHQGIILEIEDYKFLDFNDIRNDSKADFIVIDRKSVV